MRWVRPGNLHLTLRNQSGDPRRAEVRVDLDALDVPTAARDRMTAAELARDRAVPSRLDDGEKHLLLTGDISPHDTWIVRIAPDREEGN